MPTRSPGADDVVSLAARLMELDSTSGRETAVIDWVHALLEGQGWITRRIPVSPGRDDVLAMATDAPLVTLSTHLDTVPPFIAPRVEGRTLSGRGACDAKGIAAAMIVAAERLRTNGVPVALLFVVGEEVSHDGAHAANAAVARGDVPATSRVLINGEPTESTLAVGTKGAIRVDVRVKGRAAHSAYPHLGRSATLELAKLLAELEALVLPDDEILGATTVNVGTMSGGVADNVVAPAAEARLMARLVGPASDVKAALERWAAGRAELEWGVMVPAVRLGTVPGFTTSVAAYATDIPELTRWGTPYLFGPGSIHVAHTDGECVDVAELRAAVDSYVRLAGAALAATR